MKSDTSIQDNQRVNFVNLNTILDILNKREEELSEKQGASSSSSTPWFQRATEIQEIRELIKKEFK